MLLKRKDVAAIRFVSLFMGLFILVHLLIFLTATPGWRWQRHRSGPLGWDEYGIQILFPSDAGQVWK